MLPAETRERLQSLAGWLLLGGSLIPLVYFLFVFGTREPPGRPIVDVQVHYNQESWQRYSERAIINTLDELSVVHVVVSSAPNEGTRRLVAESKKHVLPLLSLYQEREDRDRWFLNTGLVRYARQELSGGEYYGVGELHLVAAPPDSEVVEGILALVEELRLVAHLHAEADTVDEVMSRHPDLKVLWAHAGMTARPERVRELLDRHSNLWVELSHRVDVAPGGKLDDNWRLLFTTHPDRFMVGTGTYSNEYWYQFRYMLGDIRKWLDQLPPEVADRISYRNAMQLFIH